MATKQDGGGFANLAHVERTFQEQHASVNADIHRGDRILKLPYSFHANINTCAVM